MMRYLISLFLIVFSTTAFADVLVEFKQPVAIKSPKGAALQLKSGVDVPIGSTITTGKGGRALLMDDSGALEEIGPQKKVTCSQPTAATAKNKTVIQGVALAFREATSQGSGPTVYGMVKMGQPSSVINRPPDQPALHGVYPTNLTLAAPVAINFRWVFDQPMDNVMIVIDDDKNDHLVKRVVDFKTGQALIGPAFFKPGMAYTWYLATESKTKVSGLTPRYPFNFLDAKTNAQFKAEKTRVNVVAKNPDGKKFLMGQLYYHYKLMDKAINELLPLYKAEPTELLKRLLLIAHYAQGWTKQADELGLSK